MFAALKEGRELPSAPPAPEKKNEAFVARAIGKIKNGR